MNYAVIIIIGMAALSRLSGNGFGAKWGMSWLPEALFSCAFGWALAYAVNLHAGWGWSVLAFAAGTGISFAGMQAATWMILRWKKHSDPNLNRTATLKPVIDWIAARFGYKLGDEGYSWIAAGVKGFIIGLPAGGIPLAILWPLGYEIGSHAQGRVEKYGIDPHAVSEVMAGAGAGLSIVLFLEVVSWI